ncbi:MAG: tyrosine-type recombinase/integrase [Acidobacteriia bacterium]|nr:tyrosine-type recombinase/integrase [Terriglobia bacterium]
MLTPYRRHLATCDHVSKGQNFTLCDCPIWCDGKLNGARYRKSLDTTNWDRALRRIQILEAGGELAPEAQTAHTLDRATESFLQDCANRNLKPSTLASYRRTLGHLTKALGATRTLTTIEGQTISDYRARRDMEPTTWRKELEHLRAFFGLCQSRKWIAENPADKRHIRMPHVDNLITLPFTPEEAGKLIAACDRLSSDAPARTPYIRKRARALVYTLLYSGLRLGDVAQLRRAALNPATRHLTLRTMKTGVPLKVLLHPDAVEALVTLPAQHPDYFFWTASAPVTRCAKNMWRTIQRLGALAGVANAHPHRFRDTFAVQLLTGGADIRTVQQLLGHSSVRTTEKHYAHFVASHQALLDSAAATLDFTAQPGRPLLVNPRQNARRNR